MTISIKVRNTYLNIKEIEMFKQILKAIQEGQQRRVHYWQLQNMSDRELRDIGVSRAEIQNKIYCE